MKNLICLFSLMFAMVLMNTNCTKPADDTIPVNFTIDELSGNWNFVSLNFNNTIYTACDPVLKANFVYCNLSFHSVNTEGTGTLRLYSNCSKNGIVDDVPNHFTLSHDANYVYQIDINGGDLKFEIQNPDKFDGKTLKVKLLTSASYLPTGGIYTLQK